MFMLSWLSYGCFMIIFMGMFSSTRWHLDHGCSLFVSMVVLCFIYGCLMLNSCLSFFIIFMTYTLVWALYVLLYVSFSPFFLFLSLFLWKYCSILRATVSDWFLKDFCNFTQPSVIDLNFLGNLGLLLEYSRLTCGIAWVDFWGSIFVTFGVL